MPATINNPVKVVIDIDADASAGVGYTVPRAGVVSEVTVICTAANAGGTVQLSSGGLAITDAITCAVLDVRTAAATIDVANGTLDAGDDLTVTTNAAADRGQVIVTLIPTGQSLASA